MRRLLAIPLIPLLVALAFAAQGHVHTDRKDARLLPLPKEEGVFHFAIFGDRTGGPREGLEVLAQGVKDANLLDPDLVLTVGDLVQGYNAREPWVAEMREYKKIMEKLRMPWYPVAGNHDVYWRGSPAPPGEHEADYEEHFGPLWYWFPHKNAAFFVLFTDEGDPATGKKGYGRPELHKFSDEQLAWLGGALEEAKAYDHVFLFMHHPRWILDIYPGSNWDKVHALLTNAGNVTAVFGGHIHRQRYDGLEDGIEYFTLSTTGGGIPMDAPGSGYLHHMNIVTVRKERISVTTVPVGAVLDPKEMTPERLKDVDLARRLPVGPLDPVMVKADGSATAELAFDVGNPTTRPLDVTVTCRAAGSDWRIGPDHHHFNLTAPGVKRVTFRMERKADDFAGTFSMPEIVLEVDYLTEARRISLGEQVNRALVRPQSIPVDAFAAKRNLALVLDGKGSGVTVPSKAFTVPDGPFSVEAWVRPGADRLTGVIAANFDFMLYLNQGVPIFGFDIGKTTAWLGSRENRLAADVWRHFAGTYDGKTLRMFLDGKQVATAEAEGSQPRAGLPLYVGAQCDQNGRPGLWFRGEINGSRISKGARYDEKGFTPAARHEPDASTLLLLHLDAPVGPFAPDHSPSAAHGCRLGRALYKPVERGEARGGD